MNTRSPARFDVESIEPNVLYVLVRAYKLAITTRLGYSMQLSDSATKPSEQP